MATVTVFTAERMQEIEDSTIIGGEIVGDNLVLMRRDLVAVDAGPVVGPPGPTGPPGGAVVISDLTDVNTGGASPGELLLFNGTDWVPGGAPVTEFSDLSDVAVAGATIGQTLTFDGTNWIPAAAALSLAAMATALSRADTEVSAQSRTAAGWGDLGTVGPEVTIDTGTLVWVDLAAEIYNPPGPGANFVYMGVEVSGASAINPDVSSSFNLYEGPMSYAGTRSYGFPLVVVAGNNTFRVKYNGYATNNPTWGHRHIRVMRLN